MFNTTGFGDAGILHERTILYPHPMQLVFMYTVAFLIISLNLPVFIVVHKIDNLPNNTAKFMIALACTDMGLGLDILVLCIYQTIRQNFFLDNNSPLCVFNGFMAPYLCSVSIMLMTFINLDKFLLLQFPFSHKRRMNGRKVNYLISALWLFFLFFYSPVFFGWGGIEAKFYPNMYFCLINFSITKFYTSLFYLLVLVFPTVSISVSFIGIYRIARKQRCLIETTHSSSITITKRQYNMIFTLLYMTAGYYIMWTPYFLFNNIWEVVTGDMLNPSTSYVFGWLAGCSSFINPLVYIPTMRQYRIRLFALLRPERLLPATARKFIKNENIVI